MADKAQDDDDVPATPRNTAPSEDTQRDLEPPDSSPASAERTDPKRRSRGSDTLLSVHPAADRADDENPMVEELERRLEQLEARIKVLELARGSALANDKRWLIWVGLLLALALGWQLRAYFP